MQGPVWKPRLVGCYLTAGLLLAACSAGPDNRPNVPFAPEPPAPVQPSPQAVAPPPAAEDEPPASAAREADIPAVEVYQRNGPSVVNITSVAVVRTRLGLAELPRGVGSGFIWDDAGHIVTNNHVIANADELTVTFKEGAASPATLVGRDPDNDLAVIRVDPNNRDEAGNAIRDRLRPVALGDSDRITIGEAAIAIGSPLGLQQTVTAGIVSALRPPGEGGTHGPVDLLGGAVQTDAAINPGNSGGPLFNAAGEVIGVNTAILSRLGGNIGLGFAIPVNVVKRVVPELIQHGCYRHPLVGVQVLSLTQLGQAAQRQLGLEPNQRGLLVQESSAGAAEAGIRGGERVVLLGGEPIRVGGDILLAVDGRPLETGGELRGYIENTKRPGDTVTFEISRDGHRQEVTVRLSERPDQQGCR
jgi:S1-C subfamily serine protease